MKYKFDESRGGVVGPSGLVYPAHNLIGNEVELLNRGFDDCRAISEKLAYEVMLIVEGVRNAKTEDEVDVIHANLSKALKEYDEAVK